MFFITSEHIQTHKTIGLYNFSLYGSPNIILVDSKFVSFKLSIFVVRQYFLFYVDLCELLLSLFKVMVYNTSFNNISVILWRSVFFLCGGNRSTRRKPPTCRKSLTKLFHIMLYWVHLAMSGIRIHNVSGYKHWLAS